MHTFRFRVLTLVGLLGASLAVPGLAQAQAAPALASSAMPAARASDVASMDAIIHAVYDVISGPKGQVRDWSRFRSLFLPSAQLIAVHRDKQGQDHAAVFTPAEFADRAGPYMTEHGFFERETHRRVERYGAVAQVFSTYASRHARSDPKPFQRGINSFQLYFDGHRWWVVTIYWQPERDGLPIPKRFGG